MPLFARNCVDTDILTQFIMWNVLTESWYVQYINTIDISSEIPFGSLRAALGITDQIFTIASEGKVTSDLTTSKLLHMVHIHST